MSLNSQVTDKFRNESGFRPWKEVQITWDAGVIVNREDSILKFNIIRGVSSNRGSAEHSFLLINLNY